MRRRLEPDDDYYEWVEQELEDATASRVYASSGDPAPKAILAVDIDYEGAPNPDDETLMSRSPWMIE